MAWPMIAALALQVGGSLISAKGQKDAGKAANKQAQQAAQNEAVAAEFEARQADYLAGQAKAVAQREAHEQRKSAGLLASRALALAAAGGGGASDPGVVDIINNIYSEGAYRSALAMYEGEEEARSLGISAQSRRLSGKSFGDARRAEGKSAVKAANTNMFSTLVSGASSALTTYGQM